MSVVNGENIKQMYKQCFRVLKNGGKLFTSCFTVETTGIGTGIKLENNTYKDIEAGRL